MKTWSAGKKNGVKKYQNALLLFLVIEKRNFFFISK